LCMEEVRVDFSGILNSYKADIAKWDVEIM
jgi:hypothetical protein